jgi:hypothetical protein
MGRRLVIWLIPLGLAVLPACSSASPAASSRPATTATVAGTTTSPAAGTAIQGRHRAALHVSPSAGGPHTVFVVSFKAPQAAGVSGIRTTTYEIDAVGPQRTGCEFSIQRTIRKARQGTHERVMLRPQAHGWCAGTFHGSVQLISGPNCGRGQVCPEFVTVAAVVGRFKFHVS